jgi:hypothetical protein
MAPVTEAELEALKAKVQAAEAALAKAEAAYQEEADHVAKVNAEMEARGEEPFTSGPNLGPLDEERRRALWARNDAVAALERALAPPAVTTPPPEPAPNPDVPETGHYDDAHSFGWRPPPAPPPDKDAYVFGWGTKKKAVVAVGIAGILAAVVAAIVALGSGGGTSKAASTSAPPVGATSTAAQASTTTVPTTGALPTNTAVAGCIAIDPRGSTTVLREAFLLVNPQAGSYTATFAKGPTGSVSGEGSASGNLVETAVTISAFGTYDGLTITAPDGSPIALGPIASQLPLVINAETDKPNGCDGGALVMPAASTGDPVTRDHAAIEAFLPTFSDASRARDVEQLVHMLDPAVLERYSAAQCTADLGAVAAEPTAAFAFERFTSGPEPFTYASDGPSTVIANTYTVAVSRTSNGTTADASIHLSVSDSGTVGWFTDCTH